MIHVLDVYQGRRTQEHPIPPGYYDEDDEQLYGLADYLVKNGHAKRVKTVVRNVSPINATRPADGDGTGGQAEGGENRHVPEGEGSSPDETPPQPTGNRRVGKKNGK